MASNLLGMASNLVLAMASTSSLVIPIDVVGFLYALAFTRARMNGSACL